MPSEGGSPDRRPSKAAMRWYLDQAGWRGLRREHEPVWYRDPLGYQRGRLRIEDAYALQVKRDRRPTPLDKEGGGR